MKHAILQISDALIVDLLTIVRVGFSGNFEVKQNGLPKDAKAISCVKVDDNIIGIVVESDSFDDIDTAHDLPILEPPIHETIPIDIDKSE